ncbi:MAG: hypothetical protein Q8Q48_02425 [Candidatus Staskawiczbacteria bacterium]|nr:hypothetical protein [Candidatus Staskawiczbacteria bacterium]
MKNLTEEKLRELYSNNKKSVADIAKIFKCSERGINYWFKKYNIPKRTISEAVYIKWNPNGDPFKFRSPKDFEEAKLFGMGIGLYWGEGNKANKNTVKLGNSDPALMRIFIKFLVQFFRIDKKDLRFHLHVFTDINLNDAYKYWIQELSIQKEQFYKPTVTITGKLGNYRKKSRYGVLSVYYANTKMRNILVGLLPG